MPRKKKGNAENASVSAASEVKSEAAATPAKKAGKRIARKAKRGPGRPKGSKKPRATTKSVRPRRYEPAERARMLAAAKREGLSGSAAAKKFGISQLTFYTWRKKAGTSTHGRRGRPKRTSLLDSRDLSGQLRQAVRAKVREMLPEVIEQEIGASLGGRASRGR